MGVGAPSAAASNSSHAVEESEAPEGRVGGLDAIGDAAVRIATST